MSVPTSYTETELAEYMHSVLGTYITSALSLSVGGSSYAEPVIDTLIELGVSDISEIEAEDIPGLRATARVMALRTAITQAAGKYDFGTDSQDFKRSQMFKNMKDALAIAETDALAAGVALAGWEVESIPISDPHDPYVYLADEFRVLP